MWTTEPCDVCLQPATTWDGIVGYLLCDRPECLTAAWDNTEFPPPPRKRQLAGILGQTEVS